MNDLLEYESRSAYAFRRIIIVLGNGTDCAEEITHAAAVYARMRYH